MSITDKKVHNNSMKVLSLSGFDILCCHDHHLSNDDWFQKVKHAFQCLNVKFCVESKACTLSHKTGNGRSLLAAFYFCRQFKKNFHYSFSLH